MSPIGKHIAAIDAGSNGIRMVVARTIAHGRVEIVETVRHAVRLGSDAFQYGEIRQPTSDKLLAAFQSFRTIFDKYNVTHYRAVATAAMREASNHDWICDRIAQTTDIMLQVIDPEEEARLVHFAISDRINLSKRVALLVDIGGGSIQLILSEKGKILAVESFRLGSVRLLQILEQEKYSEHDFYELVKEYSAVAQKWLKREISKKQIDVFVGTGGNIEAFADLKGTLLHRNSDEPLTTAELSDIAKQLQKLTLAERVTQLKLRPDRADVIVPAALVLQIIWKQVGTPSIIIPQTGLRNGILLDLAQSNKRQHLVDRHEQSVMQAYQTGRKYDFDERHAKTVAAFALQLFDATQTLHKLPAEYRALLELSAILHDIGQYVHASSHHKHSQYIVLATPLVGIAEHEREIIGNIVRYHRKSFPSTTHENFRSLPLNERIAVTQLAALLRIADALDREHESKVKELQFEVKRQNLIILISGSGDLLLEKWAVVKKAEMFEQCFSTKVTVRKKEER
ncbi:MAG: Ppx/GppA family phosphatase [bacterium]|nr:Ppx/GppA family phosphatase [bacterium]